MYWKIFHKTDESDFSTIVDVFKSGNNDKVTSFFITELQYSSLLKWKEYFSGFYKITKFLTVLYDNGFQISDDVIICLKKELKQLADSNNYEYHYYILSTLFHLRPNDKGFLHRTI